MANFTQQSTSIEIVPYTDRLRDDWNGFLDEKALNNTFLHTRDFFDHNPLNRLDDSSVIFYKGSKIIAVLPAVIYEEGGIPILHSHLRATYGGFVVSDDVGVEEAVNIVHLTILYAKERSIGQIIVRNPFRIFNTSLCDETDYALWYHGFEIRSRELEMALPIGGSLEAIRGKYHSTTRRNVRKAWKNVQVKVCDDFGQYWMLLEKCLLDRHGQKPVHDLASIMNLRERVGKDKVLLFAAYRDNILIAGIVVFVINSRVIHSQYIASDFAYQHLRPIHAVIDFIIAWGNERNLTYLNLGMANEDEGRSMNRGLFNFKESFGGRGVLRETMQYSFE